METREEWLLELVDALRSTFANVSFTIPDVRISCSWPSKSIRKRLGECWHSKASRDGRRNIFVTPLLEDVAEVAPVVVHELIHACLPDGTGHRGPFKRAMKLLGLEGKATATQAGWKLALHLKTLCEKIGPYPHVALCLSDGVTKQTTRMLKLECPNCGYTIRTTAKWLEVGIPTCACGADFVDRSK